MVRARTPRKAVKPFVACSIEYIEPTNGQASCVTWHSVSSIARVFVWFGQRWRGTRTGRARPGIDSLRTPLSSDLP
jgi:hypothetical protein